MVSDEVVDAVLISFFQSGKLLKAINATFLALIPKDPNANKVSDFRPVSCCTTLYSVSLRL